MHIAKCVTERKVVDVVFNRILPQLVQVLVQAHAVIVILVISNKVVVLVYASVNVIVRVAVLVF